MTDSSNHIRDASTFPDAIIKGAMECIVLVLLCFAPWVYGAVHPGFELLLLLGIALLLLIWAVQLIRQGSLVWVNSPILLCLAGLFLLGVWQVTPLAPSTLAVLSPSTARLYGG